MLDLGFIQIKFIMNNKIYNEGIQNALKLTQPQLNKQTKKAH